MRTLVLAFVLGLVLAGCRVKSDPTFDAVSATCAAVPHACSAHAECCSYACLNGVCIANTVAGGPCQTSDDCDYTLTCVQGGCQPGFTCLPSFGDTCGSNNECCSGNCLGESTGVYPATRGTCGTETAPVVELGGPFTIPYYATTALHATVTDPDPEDVFVYAWDVQSAPTGASAIGWTSSAAMPSIFLSAKGTYVVRVRVADGPSGQRNRSSAQDTVTLVAVNVAPVVDPDPTHLATTALRNTSVALVGTVSDPNGAASPVSCAWFAKPPGQAEISTPVASWASCPASPSASYRTPITGPEGTWEFRLEASDGELTTSAVRRVDVVNAAPVALACAYECATPPPGAVPFVRVGNLGAPGQPAPSIPLHGSATDDNGDVGSPGFTWEWRLDTPAPGSARVTGLLLGSGAGTAPPFDGALDPDVAGTYVVRLHVEDGWGAAADAIVPVVVEPWLRPLHPVDGATGLPRGSIADAVYLHAPSAASDRIVYAGHDASSGLDRLWLLDPEASASAAVAAVDLAAAPRCVGLAPDGGEAIVAGDVFGSPRWQRVSLTGVPSASGSNPFGAGWSGLPNDVIDAGGREYAVSSTGIVHQLGTSAGSSSAAATCDSSCSSSSIIASHAAGTSDTLWLLSAAGELRRFVVKPNGDLGLSPNTSLTGLATSTDLWVSALHGPSLQEIALSAGPLFDAASLNLSGPGALPSAARFLDTAAPSGALVAVMVNAAGTSVVMLDGSYGDAGALHLPRVGYLGTGYALEAVYAFVRSDGSVRYAVLRASIGGSVRWYLARY